MGAFRIQPTACCGIKELADISSLPTPEAVVKRAAVVLASDLMTYGYSRCPAWLMFSGVVGERIRVYSSHYHADRSDDYGAALAEYITAQGLGTVTESPLSRNYNGNMLRIWLWAPNWPALTVIWQESLRPAAPAASPLSVTPPPDPLPDSPF